MEEELKAMFRVCVHIKKEEPALPNSTNDVIRPGEGVANKVEEPT